MNFSRNLNANWDLRRNDLRAWMKVNEKDAQRTSKSRQIIDRLGLLMSELNFRFGKSEKMIFLLPHTPQRFSIKNFLKLALKSWKSICGQKIFNRSRHSDSSVSLFESVFWGNIGGCSPFCLFAPKVDNCREIKTLRNESRKSEPADMCMRWWFPPVSHKWTFAILKWLSCDEIAFNTNGRAWASVKSIVACEIFARFDTVSRHLLESRPQAKKNCSRVLELT